MDVLLDGSVVQWLTCWPRSTPYPVTTWMGDCLQTGKPPWTSWYASNHLGQLSFPSLRGTLIEYWPFSLRLGGAHSLVSGVR